jgi:hypothetical protein
MNPSLPVPRNCLTLGWFVLGLFADLVLGANNLAKAVMIR